MERAVLGGIELSVVVSDEPIREAEVTEKPVERGQDISDHVKMKPKELSISGVVVGDDAAIKLKKLEDFQRTGKLLNYVHRVGFQNVVIQSLNTRHHAGVANGFEFDMVLKLVRIAVPKEVAITNLPAKTATKTKKTTTAGRKQPKDANTQTSWAEFRQLEQNQTAAWADFRTMGG